MEIEKTYFKFSLLQKNTQYVENELIKIIPFLEKRLKELKKQLAEIKKIRQERTRGHDKRAGG